MHSFYWEWDNFQFGLSHSRMKAWTFQLLASHIRDGNRSADFSFPCFLLIIIPILVPNAIICDTKPGPRLHPGFERCQLLIFFKQQEPKAKSRDSKWSGIKDSVSEKSQLLWTGNQSNQWAQRGRRCLLLEGIGKICWRHLQLVQQVENGGSIPLPGWVILPWECLKLLIWEGCFALFLLNLCYQTAERTEWGWTKQQGGAVWCAGWGACLQQWSPGSVPAPRWCMHFTLFSVKYIIWPGEMTLNLVFLILCKATDV